jgi:hypothetical protein
MLIGQAAKYDQWRKLINLFYALKDFQRPYCRILALSKKKKLLRETSDNSFGAHFGCRRMVLPICGPNAIQNFTQITSMMSALDLKQSKSHNFVLGQSNYLGELHDVSGLTQKNLWNIEFIASSAVSTQTSTGKKV